MDVFFLFYLSDFWGGANFWNFLGFDGGLANYIQHYGTPEKSFLQKPKAPMGGIFTLFYLFSLSGFWGRKRLLARDKISGIPRKFCPGF